MTSPAIRASCVNVRIGPKQFIFSSSFSYLYYYHASKDSNFRGKTSVKYYASVTFPLTSTCESFPFKKDPKLKKRMRYRP